MELDQTQVRQFFATARERQMILLRRSVGQPRELWTSDPVMRQYHFCNVFRCDDRVSKVILQMAAAWGDPWRAALAGRLINRYDTIAQLTSFNKPVSSTILNIFIKNHGLNTNAYRLNTPLGLNNKDGVVRMYEQGLSIGSSVLAAQNLEDAMKAMIEIYRLGAFVRYQIALDLIELKAFPKTFRDDTAFPGHGAGRGASRLLGINPSGSWVIRKNESERYDSVLVSKVMSKLVELSLNSWNWPPRWRAWTIHEAEGWLCEYDKWARRTYDESPGGRKFKPRIA